MRRLLSRCMASTCLILCAVLVAVRLGPKPMLLDGLAFSPVICDRNEQPLRVALASDDTFREFVPLEKISPLLVKTTLLYEDRYFYQHTGANPVALIKACWNEFRGVGRRIGASTITMQVARMRYHLNTRTWGGKLRQIALAARLECFYSKRDILEAYFNLAPYGRNIEGAGAAARIYFGKEAADLGLAEALTLSVIPQNPSRRAPNPKTMQALLEARKVLFNEWVGQHPADEAKRSLLDMPLQIGSLGESPFHAPHFTEDLLRSPELKRGRMRTTLDLELQKLLERQITRFVEENDRRGVANAAALLIDYQTMEVLASIGSADYFNKEISGQVNGATMKRSPGSALKPFVYALALDQGIIQPHSLLKDAPTSFNGYNPENFDRDFMGPVQACEALVQSRNVPAVYLASKLKEHSLYELLEHAQVSGLRAEKSYGLTIPLGGAEVSPGDLARLYAMLANRGRYRPLRKNADTPADMAVPLLSPEAAFLVLDMLKNNKLAEGNASATGREHRAIAWKTGTSYSFRDAWTAGVFDRYVLVTWVGNFDGKPSPVFVGRSAAAPLFFSMVKAIRAQSPVQTVNAAWESNAGLKLESVELCALTGELATPHCAHRSKGWFIPGVSPIAKCGVHQEIWIDARSGGRITAAEAGPDARREVWEVWPSDLAALFRFAGLPRRQPPAFARESSARYAAREEGPRIVSPRQGIEYTLRLNGSGQTIPLQADAASTTAQIYWFAGKTYLGSSAPGETFLWRAAPGLFRIRAVDGAGRSAERQLVIAASL